MSKQKINSCQKNKLLELITNKPQLRTGKFTATFTHKMAQKEWQEIASTLNAIPGANKDWKAWRKTWQDYLSKTKSKSATINKIRRGTGGGPPPQDTLDEFEEGVAALIHPHAVRGHTDSAESTATFDFEVAVSVPIQGTMEVVDPLSELPINDETVVPPMEFGGDIEAIGTQPLQTNDDLVPPPIAFVGDSGDVERTELQPPQTNNTQKKKKKVNLKSLLEEKVKIKKKLLEAKSKFYEQYIQLIERQTRALEEMARYNTSQENNNNINSINIATLRTDVGQF